MEFTHFHPNASRFKIGQFRNSQTCGRILLGDFQLQSYREIGAESNSERILAMF